jgi:hypothetical protein
VTHHAKDILKEKSPELIYRPRIGVSIEEKSVGGWYMSDDDTTTIAASPAPKHQMSHMKMRRVPILMHRSKITASKILKYACLLYNQDNSLKVTLALTFTLVQ